METECSWRATGVNLPWQRFGAVLLMHSRGGLEIISGACQPRESAAGRAVYFAPFRSLVAANLNGGKALPMAFIVHAAVATTVFWPAPHSGFVDPE